MGKGLISFRKTKRKRKEVVDFLASIPYKQGVGGIFWMLHRVRAVLAVPNIMFPTNSEL